MSIHYDDTRKLFSLTTAHTEYQIKIGPEGRLLHLYYGKKVGGFDMGYLRHYQDRGFSGGSRRAKDGSLLEESVDLAAQEYTGNGVGDYRITSVSAVSPDGSRSVDFYYRSHEILSGKPEIPGLPSVRGDGADVKTLRITLSDPVTGLGVILSYSVFDAYDIITRSAELFNEGSGTIRLEKAASLCLDFPNGPFELIHFHGRHCMERQPERVRLTHAIHTVSSRRGMSSHHHNPFVILARPSCTEESGECCGIMLMYSGSFKAEIEQDQEDSVRAVIGIQDENFTWELKSGAHFCTPEAVLSFSADGLGLMSRQYHRLIRDLVLPPRHRGKKRPVLINSWEAAYFDFDEEKLLHLAQQASELGIDMFVLDDGWFGKRNFDDAGLGDWTVNLEKLPGGISSLAEQINRMGMSFGIWMEPEMVNEDSDLFRSHPDWILADPGRRPSLARNQMVLDMGRKDVRDYLFDAIDTLLRSANIEYIKWDFNRSLSNFYSAVLPKERQGETAHRFMLGTYELLDRLTKAYPDLLIEGCSGGGGRFDLGMLYYSPQIWCSDNTDPIARLTIQEGTSYGYPPCTMGSHVSASPNHQSGRSTPLETRGVTAMCGAFGYELDLGRLSDEEKEKIREQIAYYRKIEHLIREGSYYRLVSVLDGMPFRAFEYVLPDASEALVGIVTTDAEANAPFPFVTLKGLEENAVYRLDGTDRLFSGAALMYGGVTLPVQTGDYPAVQLLFRREA